MLALAATVHSIRRFVLATALCAGALGAPMGTALGARSEAVPSARPAPAAAAERRREPFVVVIGALTAIVVAFAVVRWRARKKRGVARPSVRPRAVVDANRASASAPETAASRAVDAVSMRHCSVCRRDYPPGTAFCARDGSELVPSLQRLGPEGGFGLVCPVCGRGYAAGTQCCPGDGEELVPYAYFAATVGVKTDDTERFCPTCGVRTGKSELFCNKDGTPLVSLN